MLLLQPTCFKVFVIVVDPSQRTASVDEYACSYDSAVADPERPWSDQKSVSRNSAKSTSLTFHACPKRA